MDVKFLLYDVLSSQHIYYLNTICSFELFSLHYLQGHVCQYGRSSRKDRASSPGIFGSGTTL